jgi:hypothetical protein
MVCKLCQTREANKKNTHYLTDGIIRTALNQAGSNEREKGFYFDLSNDNPYVAFNFQRGTSVQNLEDALGRPATEEEIDQAKRIPFSVDYVFCSECEDKFTKIESPFLDKILPLFRDSDLSGTETIVLSRDETKLAKLFFYLQVWRTSICEKIFNLNQETAEELRCIIENYETIEEHELNLPILITYLETTGGEAVYTENFVGVTDDKNPNIILMNDFIIQFFDDKNSITKISFYGLNESGDFNYHVNTNSEDFKIKVFHNAERKAFLKSMSTKEKAQHTVAHYIESFAKIWYLTFGTIPNEIWVQQYLEFLFKDDFMALSHTEEMIIKKTKEFIMKRI